MPRIAAINYRQRVRIIGSPLTCMRQLSAHAHKTSYSGDPVPSKILDKSQQVLNHPFTSSSIKNIHKNKQPWSY
jgi:hypothetical protein